MSVLLCFSGRIGSGKSSVSLALAEALGWRRASFGDFLRGEIRRLGGDPSDRQTLQDLGQQRVDSDAPAFCRDVLAAGGFLPSDHLIVDGIRHVRIFDLLTEACVPLKARLVFLAAHDETISERVGKRGDAHDHARATGHRVEAEMRDDLPRRADALVDADRPFDEVVAECLRLVSRWDVPGD